MLMALAEVCIGWLLVRHAALAARKLDGSNKGDKGGAKADAAGDAAFYTGKIASARFFCAEVLPRLAAERRLVETGTLALMQLPDAAFGP